MHEEGAQIAALVDAGFEVFGLRTDKPADGQPGATVFYLQSL